jgi:multimeric flavodoxin WrbA
MSAKVTVLGVAGSPRRGGNTETLLDEVLRGAMDAGAETEKVVLAQSNIGPCRACNACSRTGICIQDDDMGAIIEKMKASRVWVLATPVYWWGPTAQMKAFIDRWYSIPRVIFKGKRIILAASSNGGETYQELMVEMFIEIIDYLGMEKYRVLQAAGTDAKTSARNNSALIEAAHAAGFDAIKTLGDH